MKNKRQIEFGCCYDKLSTLIERINAARYTVEDYSKFEFELDYCGCYYEGDPPSISCNYNERL